MLDPFLPPFLHYLRFEKRYSPHTLTAYENDLRQLSDYFALHYPSLAGPADITHHIIRSWLAYVKEHDAPAPTSLNRKSASLSAFFRHLMRIGVMESNPVRQLHSQRLPQRLPQFLKEVETDKLINEHAFGPGIKGATDRLICELLYNTGMRRQELVTLTEDDVEWSLKQLRVLGKGGKERLIPLSEAVLDALRDYIAAKKKELEHPDAKALLVLESGKPLYPGYVYRVVQDHLKDTGVTLKKKSPHILRHTFATHLLNNGASIQAIKELLGHASLAATQVYTHNNIAQLKEIHKKSHPRG